MNAIILPYDIFNLLEESMAAIAALQQELGFGAGGSPGGGARNSFHYLKKVGIHGAPYDSCNGYSTCFELR